MKRFSGLTALIVSVVVLTSSCGTPLPEAMAENLVVPPPAVTQVQAQDVTAAVGDVLATADAALDAGALATRLSGPALAMRTAEYVRSTATEGAKTPTALPATSASAVLPQTDEWPRTFLVLTDQPDDLSAQRVLVMRQESARDQYTLWGWARLFQGITMPATAALDVGSPVVADDDAGLLVPPGQVTSQYVDVLTNGAESPAVQTFAADPFRTAAEANRAAQAEKLTQAGASFTETYETTGTPAVSLSTVDGGALVVGVITMVSTATAANGGKLDNSDPFAAALAGGPPSKSLTRTYTVVVMFYVPSAEVGGAVQPLAAEQIVTSAAVS